MLSALLAVVKLRGHMAPADLVSVVMLIEATIPFRRDADGAPGWVPRLGARARAAARLLVRLSPSKWPWGVFPTLRFLHGTLFFFYPLTRSLFSPSMAGPTCRAV